MRGGPMEADRRSLSSEERADALEESMMRRLEETVLACLLHDIAVNLIKVDHGWWAAQMVEPYVPEKVSWAIRYHQALRFFPDPAVGYGYPDRYVQIFGEGYVPEPYIKAAY